MEEFYSGLISLAELIPIAVIGLLVGGVSYYAEKEPFNDGDRPKKDENIKDKNLSDAVKHSFYALVVCVIVYSCLSATDLPYLAKIGVASALSFFGFDNALGIIERVLNLRGSRK